MILLQIFSKVKIPFHSPLVSHPPTSAEVFTFIPPTLLGKAKKPPALCKFPYQAPVYEGGWVTARQSAHSSGVRGRSLAGRQRFSVRGDGRPVVLAVYSLQHLPNPGTLSCLDTAPEGTEKRGSGLWGG